MPIPSRTGNILHMGETPKAEQRLPTSRAKPCPIANRGEEGPCSWKVQLKDGVEVRYAHLDSVTGRPDGLVDIKSSPSTMP